MVTIIAEAGVNHNGDKALALELIDAAAEAKADAVKFQTFQADVLDPPGDWRDMIRALELSRDVHFDLKQHAEDLGIEFISTPFDVDSLRFLVDDLKVKTLKIASGHHENVLLLKAAGASLCKIILSTGMATIFDVYGAVQSIGRPVTLLHCTSAYPCPYQDVNLRAMGTLWSAFGECYNIGLSDHTEGIAIPLAAAALGAVVIEKHFTLNRSMDGPDHRASIEPDELAAMVRGIRQVTQAIGDGTKQPRESENFARGIAAERKAWRESLT